MPLKFLGVTLVMRETLRKVNQIGVNVSVDFSSQDLILQIPDLVLKRPEMGLSTRRLA